MPVYVGANGMIFRARVLRRNGEPVDLRDAVELYFALRKPKQKGRIKCWAVAGGDDGSEMTYTSTSADLDRTGSYSVQGYARFLSGERFPTSIHTFLVSQG